MNCFKAFADLLLLSKVQQLHQVLTARKKRINHKLSTRDPDMS